MSTGPTGEKASICEKQLGKLLAKYCRDMISEEFPPELRHGIMQTIRRTQGGKWELRKLPVSVRAIVEPFYIYGPYKKTLTNVPDPYRQIIYDYSFLTSRAREWQFETRGTDPSLPSPAPDTAAEPRRMPIGTYSALMLFHDLLAPTPDGKDFISHLLAPGRVVLNWICTKWQLGGLPAVS